jgi:2-oxoglutarate ferredoxin oxidoreductase subunit beta
MTMAYRRPAALEDAVTHYCPGCGHGIVHKLIAEVVDEMELGGRMIGIAPVGCAVLAYDYFTFDVCEAPHGRTPAVATGIKRARPGCVVFSYQGDGDLAAIGTAEIIHAANRGENISVIFVNNAVYGMTGGQMAPTTPDGGKTTTSPRGRNPLNEGHPIKVAELLANFERVVYSARVSLSSPKNVREAKRAIARSFETQLAEKGFSIVEILSPCPTYWHMSPEAAMEYIDKTMTKTFPPATFKDWEK